MTDEIAGHYAGGGLLAAIGDGLERAGTTPGQATVDDLASVDEFHLGGRPATRHLCERMTVAGDDHVLDIGCGIGGTARFLASEFGCSVTGIDLTPEYIDVARELSRWVGLADRNEFVVGDALDTRAAADTFDAAVLVHVGMNIADKHGAFAEARRVLRPGGVFGVYDIMRAGVGDISFPVPWASDEPTSHVDTAETYRAALESAGFEIVAVEDRGDFARDFVARLRQANVGGPPPLGTHLIMGADAPTKIANVAAAISAGTVAPTEIVARKPE